MCKRDTESVKVAPENVLSNRGKSPRYALDRGWSGGCLQEGVISVHRSRWLRNKSKVSNDNNYYSMYMDIQLCNYV